MKKGLLQNAAILFVFSEDRVIGLVTEDVLAEFDEGLGGA